MTPKHTDRHRQYHRRSHRPGPVLVHDALHQLAQGYVIDNDRAWFDARPDETVRYRPAFDHEFCDPAAYPRCVLAFPAPPPVPGLELVLMVEVTRVTVGRLREPYWLIAPEEAAS